MGKALLHEARHHISRTEKSGMRCLTTKSVLRTQKEKRHGQAYRTYQRVLSVSKISFKAKTNIVVMISNQ